MVIYRYWANEKHQDSADLSPDDVMDELSKVLTSDELADEFAYELPFGGGMVSYRDLSYALQLMQRKGFGNSLGRWLPGIEELLQRLRQEKQSQLQRLLEILPPEAGEELKNQLQSVLDGASHNELAKLAANLEALYAGDKLNKPDSGLGAEALGLIKILQKIEELEAQLEQAKNYRSLACVDGELMKELMGEEAAAELEQLREIPGMLEEAGYIQQKDGKYELTPLGMRKIGQKALEDIFAQLRQDRRGAHLRNFRGKGGERIEETKRYEFGDDFHFHLQQTLMNSLYREPKNPPLKLSGEDFEVYQTEALTRSATVLMVDLSASMPRRGNFEAAKRVAVALDSLIRSRYPQDSLYIVGFSGHARRIKKEDLSYMNWDGFDPNTNMQHGFYLARKLLSKEKCPNKQIILISDGEPTAHFEGRDIVSQYPPTPRTLQLTLQEVMNCTRNGVVINIFMLGKERSLTDFVTQMARINKGRVFFAAADRLGQYLLVDYITSKRKSRRLAWLASYGRPLSDV